MAHTKSASDSAQDVILVMDPGKYIDSLAPNAKSKMREVLFSLAYAGYGRLRVTSGLRTKDEQWRLFGLGRSKAQCRVAGCPEDYALPDQKEVTEVTPKGSKHCRGLAIDIGIQVYPETSWQAIGAIIERSGLTWGGSWLMRDYCHIEIPGK